MTPKSGFILFTIYFLVIKKIMNKKFWLSIYGQSTVEEKVPSEQLFISVSGFLLFFFQKKNRGCG